MAPDINDGRPQYLRLADTLRGEIESGRLGPGDQLPTVAKLSKDHGMAKMTVEKAIAQLREDGLVVSWQGRGSFVRVPEDTSVPQPRGATAYAEIMKHLDQLLAQVEQLESRVTALESDGQPARRGRRSGGSAD